MMRRSCFYDGVVFHKRFRPVLHQFTYRVFNVFLDLDELGSAGKWSPFFSVNRPNIVSFHESDHGDPEDTSGRSLKQRTFALLEENGVAAGEVSKIYLLAYPRIFGFAFNPLSVFYCHDARDRLIAVIYEVRNTFGERHNYIYDARSADTDSAPHHADKVFHVSPFFDRDGAYRFTLRDGDDTKSVLIQYHKDGEPLLNASFHGARRAFSAWAPFFLSLKIPFMTVKVVAGILFEATRLWLKRLRVYPHPERHPYQSSKANAPKAAQTHAILASNDNEARPDTLSNQL